MTVGRLDSSTGDFLSFVSFFSLISLSFLLSVLLQLSGGGGEKGIRRREGDRRLRLFVDNTRPHVSLPLISLLISRNKHIPEGNLYLAAKCRKLYDKISWES